MLARWFLLALAGIAWATQAPEGVIEVLVRDSVNGYPVAGVKLILIGSGSTPRAHSGVTDAAGTFRFQGLPAGSYELSASKLGYVGSNYAGARPERINLKPGAITESLVISLVPTATISGRVLDESGGPLAGVTIWANTIPATTDEAGRYRLEYLRPGNQQLRINMPLSLRRSTLKKDPETGDLWGYCSTSYYPGVEHAEAAAPVPVGAGIHLEGFDIALRRIRLIDLKGRVVDGATGGPFSSGAVELHPGENPFNDDAYERQALDRDGGFHFELISPARYRLLLYHGPDDPLPYVRTLDISLKGPAEVLVSVPPAVQLEGRVRPPADRGGDWGTLMVTLDPRLRGVKPREVKVNGESFVIHGVPPGELAIRVAWSDGRPKDWCISQIRLGTADPRKTPVAVKEGGNPPLEITLSDKGGGISGRVLGSQVGVRPSVVFVYTASSAAMRNVSPIWTRPDGSFIVEGLAPDEYTIALEGSVADRKCASDRAKVVVEAGKTAAVELRHCDGSQ